MTPEQQLRSDGRAKDLLIERLNNTVTKLELRSDRCGRRNGHLLQLLAQEKGMAVTSPAFQEYLQAALRVLSPR